MSLARLGREVVQYNLPFDIIESCGSFKLIGGDGWSGWDVQSSRGSTGCSPELTFGLFYNWSGPRRFKYPGLGLWKPVRTMDGVSMDERALLLNRTVGICEELPSLSLLGHFLWDLDRVSVRKGG